MAKSKTKNKQVVAERNRACNQEDDSKAKWKVSPHIAIIELPDRECYLFNHFSFCPIRTNSSRGEVEHLVEKIRHTGTKTLSKEAIDLFAEHGIIIRRDNVSRPADEWPIEDIGKSLAGEEFTFQVNVPIQSITKVCQVIESALSSLKAKQDSLPKINLKLLVGNNLLSQSVSGCVQLAGMLIRHIGNGDNVNTYVESPISFISTNYGRLTSVFRPSIRLSCTLSNRLSERDLTTLCKLANEGYKPHLTLHVFPYNVNEIAEMMHLLASRLGSDGFYFALVPKLPSANLRNSTKEDTLVQTDELIGLLEQYHSSSSIELSQSYLYIDLKRRIGSHTAFNLFPSLMCAGRRISIDGQGKTLNHHNAAADGRSAEKRTCVSPNPDSGFFGNSRFAVNKCRRCNLRYFCGGICDDVAIGIEAPGTERKLFELHCAIRKTMLLHFFEDATSGGDTRDENVQKHRFESGAGKLELVST